MTAKPLLTVTEVADFLRVTGQTVHKLLDRGELTRIRVGRRVRISPEDLDAYVQRSREKPAPPPAPAAPRAVSPHRGQVFRFFPRET